MTVSYTDALKAFQKGEGTSVQANPEQTRIIFCIPEIDAPPIKIPKENADQLGAVQAAQLTDKPMQGRRGTVEGNGIVFRNLAENSGAGLWQAVHTNGKEVIIFNNATPQQFAQMQEYIAKRLKTDGNHLTLDSLDAALRYATKLGLSDHYNTTVETITNTYQNVLFTNSTPLQMPIKNPTKTKALFIPPNTPLAWNPNGTSIQSYNNGSFLIISKEENGIVKELRHLNLDDAERKYQLLDGEPVKLRDTASPNVQVFSERTWKIDRNNETTPPFPG